MIETKDQERILTLLLDNKKANGKLSNPHNSIILYITGLSDNFNFTKERSDTIGGSPPDIDIDHDALDREVAIKWVTDYWGQEHVANIITHGTFKPKSLARSYYRVTEGESSELKAILGMIPPPKYGREATLEEIVDVHPELSEDIIYENFYTAAQKLGNMVSNFGIHAAGIVISDFPISDVVPTWKNSKAESITQWDKKEVEELGLIKFDFLSIDTLSIVKEVARLIKEEKDIDIDPYSIEDEDERTYQMLEHGLLTGVFQMETSGMAKRLITKIKPRNIEELSDISALNRPGPLQANLDDQYIDNRRNGYPPHDLPDNIAKELENSYWTLIYQEQVMAICSNIAGFSERESDDIRRAMGKKDVKVLDEYKQQFLEHSVKSGGLTKKYAAKLWKDLIGFADYCLSGKTRVQTLEMGPVNIETLVEKQLPYTVLSVDEKGIIKPQKIRQWHRKGVKPVYKYTLDDGQIIICTPDHKFMTEDGSMLSIETIWNNSLPLKT